MVVAVNNLIDIEFMDWLGRIIGEKVVRAVGCLPKTKQAGWWLWGGGAGAGAGGRGYQIPPVPDSISSI